MSDAEERQLLARIGAEDGPAIEGRLIYADWCEERGRTQQAELLRLACALEGQLVPDAATERHIRSLPAPELPCALAAPEWLDTNAAQLGVPRELTVYGGLATLPADWIGTLCRQLEALPSVTRVLLWLDPVEVVEDGTWWDPAMPDLLALPQLRSLQIARVAPDLRLAKAIAEAGGLRELSLPAVDDPAWIRAGAGLSSLRGFDLSLVPAESSDDLVKLLGSLELESLALSVGKLDLAGEQALAAQTTLRKAELDSLRIRWGRSRTVRVLAGLPALESLSVSVGSRRPARRLLNPLVDCAQLRFLSCWVPSGAPGLVPASVEHLELRGPDSLPALPAGLRCLLTQWPLQSTAGIEAAARLEHLQLETESLAPSDFARLLELRSLRSLTVCGALNDALLAQIANLTQLEALELRGDGPDLDFSPLRALGALQRLETSPWNAPPAALRQLTGLPCSDELMQRADAYERHLSA